MVLGAVFGSKGLLLIQRARAPFAGLWGMPGGKVQFGEGIDEAVERELAEEAGIRARFEELCGVVSERLVDGQQLLQHYILFVCRLRALSAAVRPSGEGILQWLPVPAVRLFRGEIIPSDRLMLERLVLGQPQQRYYRCVVAVVKNRYRVKRFG